MAYTKREFKVDSSDGVHHLAGFVYLPEGEVKGLFHIVHGMTEYIERYERIFTDLATEGYICFGYDHLGHGKTAKDKSELGYIADKDGYDLLCRDIKVFSDAVRAKFDPEGKLPYYLMGHSMGSFTKAAVAMTISAPKFVMIPLPYAEDALVPIMSERTLYYHYGKHYKTYIENTNRLIAGTPYEGMSLKEVVEKSNGVLFNNAAQALNHEIYFDGLTPVQKVMPKSLEKRIVHDFGSIENFEKQFENTAVGLFGSGWVWLAENDNGELYVVPTKDADNPLCHNLNPLVCIDVWEHAYYLDYQNRRADFVREYMKLIDWDKAILRSKYN